LSKLQIEYQKYLNDLLLKDNFVPASLNITAKVVDQDPTRRPGQSRLSALN